MTAGMFSVDDKWARAIMDSWKTNPEVSTKRQRKIFTALGENRVLALLVTMPKRGGGVKFILLSETLDSSGIERLLSSAEEHYRGQSARKAFVYVPVADTFMQRVARDAGYFTEGLLREPFRRGAHFLIYSKFLQKSLSSSK